MFAAIDPIIVGVCAVVLVFFVWQWISMWRNRRRLLSAVTAFIAATEEAATLPLEEVANGLPGESLEQLRGKLGEIEGPARRWWMTLDPYIEAYEGPWAVRQGFYVTRPHGEILSHDEIVEPLYHGSRYHAIPAVITGVGLLGTFLAILVALSGVHYNEQDTANPVSGIGGLINGLSGKFLCSVVALIFSIWFTFLEKSSERRVGRTYSELVERLRAIIPLLSSTRILSDIQMHSRSMAASVSNISSDFVGSLTKSLRNDLAPAFAQGVSLEMAGRLQEEFRPTMQQMAQTLEALRTTIEGLHAKKEESVTDELRSMMTMLADSINESLGRMSTQFHDALTGAARSEFGNIEKTLTGTAAVLQDMNAGFASLQAALNQLIEKAEQTTNSQLKAGQQQVETMTAVMDGLLRKMQESTESNLSNITAQLTVVVAGFTSETKELLSSVRAATTQTEQSGTRVIQEAGKWSADASARLEMLLGEMEKRAFDFQSAGHALSTMQSSLMETIKQNNQALASLSEASKTVQSYTGSLAGQAKSVLEAGNQHAAAAALTKQVTANLENMIVRHEELVGQYGQTLRQSQIVLTGLDKELEKVLGAVQHGLRASLDAVERNFREVVKLTNNTVPDLAKAFSAQIEELNGQLQELGDVIDRGIQRFNGTTR